MPSGPALDNLSIVVATRRLLEGAISKRFLYSDGNKLLLGRCYVDRDGRRIPYSYEGGTINIVNKKAEVLKFLANPAAYEADTPGILRLIRKGKVNFSAEEAQRALDYLQSEFFTRDNIQDSAQKAREALIAQYPGLQTAKAQPQQPQVTVGPASEPAASPRPKWVERVTALHFTPSKPAVDSNSEGTAAAAGSISEQVPRPIFINEDVLTTLESKNPQRLPVLLTRMLKGFEIDQEIEASTVRIALSAITIDPDLKEFKGTAETIIEKFDELLVPPALEAETPAGAEKPLKSIGKSDIDLFTTDDQAARLQYITHLLPELKRGFYIERGLEESFREALANCIADPVLETYRSALWNILDNFNQLHRIWGEGPDPVAAARPDLVQELQKAQQELALRTGALERQTDLFNAARNTIRDLQAENASQKRQIAKLETDVRAKDHMATRQTVAAARAEVTAEAAIGQAVRAQEALADQQLKPSNLLRKKLAESSPLATLHDLEKDLKTLQSQFSQIQGTLQRLKAREQETSALIELKNLSIADVEERIAEIISEYQQKITSRQDEFDESNARDAADINKSIARIEARSDAELAPEIKAREIKKLEADYEERVDQNERELKAEIARLEKERDAKLTVPRKQSDERRGAEIKLRGTLDQIAEEARQVLAQAGELGQSLNELKQRLGGEQKRISDQQARADRLVSQQRGLKRQVAKLIKTNKEEV